MKIETERVVLRKPNINDSESLAKNGNEKSMFYYTWYIQYPFTQVKAKKIISWLNNESKKKENGVIVFCIVPKEIKKAVGIVDLYDINKKDKKAKIGFWIGKNYRGKGLTYEAVKSVLDLAFNKLNLNKVSADVLVDNKASNKLLEKLGFRKVGVMKKEKIIEGKVLDCFLWEIVNAKSD